MQDQPVYSDTVPLNAVVAQDPPPGTAVSPGAAIRVSLSRGPSPFAPPASRDRCGGCQLLARDRHNRRPRLPRRVAGSVAAFTFWLQELTAPQVVLLGSGNRLSLLVTDGPARLLLATGDSPIDYENALTHVRPIFARRVDVLLVAGSGDTLLVPLAAHGDSHVRSATALAPLPRSAEAEAMGAVPSFSSPQRIRLGPSVQVTVETALPSGRMPMRISGLASNRRAW